MVIGFQVFLSNTNNFQIDLDVAQTGTTTPDQSELGVIAMKGYSTHSNGALQLIEVYWQTLDTTFGGFLLLCKGIQMAYSKSCQQGYIPRRAQNKEKITYYRLINTTTLSHKVHSKNTLRIKKWKRKNIHIYISHSKCSKPFL